MTKGVLEYYGRCVAVSLGIFALGCGTASEDEEFTIGVGSGTSSGVGISGSSGPQRANDDGGVDGSDSDSEVNIMMGDGGPEDLSPETSCDVIDESWPEEWAAFEEQVLFITNEYRAQSVDCRSGGFFPPTIPLEDDPLLRCAARRHSLDMLQRGFFDHVSPDGIPPPDRVLAAGYTFRAVGENIAAGQMTPQAVVDGWVASDGHCANLMSSNFEELGTGYVKAPGRLVHYWTQVFGAPN